MTDADKHQTPEEVSEYWARYYEVTVDRPAWETVRTAIAKFAAEDAAAGDGLPGRGAAPHEGTGPDGGSAPAGSSAQPARFAVDLGCGGGRDARELLRSGWRVLAVDREPAAIETLRGVVPPEQLPMLETGVEDLATVSVPACDLVNASLCLPFLVPDKYWATWGRVLAALPIGGRVSAMLFGDKDASADDPEMTCVHPETIRESLSSFEIEQWSVTEEDRNTALGEPHHFHLIELVARRVS